MSKLFGENNTRSRVLRKGFSLVEMIVYIAVLTLLLTVVMSVVVSIVRSHRAVKASRSVETSAIISLERITREVRQADSVNMVSSILNISPGHLVLNGTDGDGNPRTAEFYLSSDAIYMKENEINLGPLTQPDARITDLVFHLFSTTTVAGIRVEVSIESGTSTYYKSGTFYSSATIR